MKISENLHINYYNINYIHHRSKENLKIRFVKMFLIYLYLDGYLFQLVEVNFSFCLMVNLLIDMI